MIFTPFAFREQKEVGIPYTPPDIVTDGLVFWLDSDNPNTIVNSTTVRNSVDTSHTGSLNNVSFVSDPSASYFLFEDATMNNIIFNNISSLQFSSEFTVMLWMYATTGEDDNAAMIAKTAAAAGTTTNWAADFAGNGTLRSFYYNSTTPVIVNASNKADVVGQYGLLAITFNGGTFKIYTNNTLRGTTTSGLTTVNSSTNPLYIGSRGNVQKYNGRIAQVMLYDVELTGAELTQNFDNTKAAYGL